MDFAVLQKNHPQHFKGLASKISNCFDSKYTSQFFYTISKKEGNWFGETKINLVLKLPLNSEHLASLYYEKDINLTQQLNYKPHEPIKYVLLNDMKMIARSANSLTVAFAIQNKKLEEWIFHFYNQQMAAQWQSLLKEKKNQLKKLKIQNNDKQTQVKELKTKIKSLEKELSDLKIKCQLLLSQKEAFQTKNLNLVKHNNKLIQQNSSLNQANAQYRKILMNIDDYQSLAQQKQRKSVPKEIEHSFKAQDGIAIFYMSWSQWKQCLLKIQAICAGLELPIQKNRESKEFEKLVKQLKTSVNFLKSSVVVLAAKDHRKSLPSKNLQKY